MNPITHSFSKYTVFRTVRSICESNNNISPCIVAFTPCNDMMLGTMDYELSDKTLSGLELQDVLDTFDYLLKNQFDLFAKSAIYKGNSSPLNISELVDEVIEIMEKNYNFYRCSIEIVKSIEDVYLEELTGIRDINKTKEIKKVNIQFIDWEQYSRTNGMVTEEDKIKAKKLEEEYQNKK